LIPRIEHAEACGSHSLRLVFNDGTRKRVNVLSLLQGPIFEPLLDPKYFRRVLLDPVAGTVVWPNGADLAPEALFELAGEHDANWQKRPSRKALKRPAPKQRR